MKLLSGLSILALYYILTSCAPAQKDPLSEELVTFSKEEIARYRKYKYATLETSLGTIKFEFYWDAAPGHCVNFIKLAQKGFYDGVKIFRVVKDFVLQTGCPRGDGEGSPGYRIPAEFSERKHLFGTVSMARDAHPDTAGSQFFICLNDLPRLDGKYSVFGQVIDGLVVVKAIGNVEVNEETIDWNGKKVKFDKPKDPIYITKVEVY